MVYDLGISVILVTDYFQIATNDEKFMLENLKTKQIHGISNLKVFPLILTIEFISKQTAITFAKMKR